MRRIRRGGGNAWLAGAGGFAVAAGIGLACAGPAPPPSLQRTAWEGTAEEANRLTGLCVLSLQSESELEPERLERFQEIIHVAVRSHGFHVVDAKATNAVYERISKEAGGSYDPLTGRRDPGGSERVAAALESRLAPEVGCQAYLLPRIAFVTATWDDGIAEWDGAQARLPLGSNAHGTCPALSVWLSLRAFDGRLLYFRAAGIELAAKLVGGGLITLPEFADIPPGERLRDDGLFRSAVTRALQELARPAAPEPASSVRGADSARERAK